jgi:hypothetical protein
MNLRLSHYNVQATLIDVEEAVDIVAYDTCEVVFVLLVGGYAASPSDLQEPSLTQNYMMQKA